MHVHKLIYQQKKYQILLRHSVEYKFTKEQQCSQEKHTQTEPLLWYSTANEGTTEVKKPQYLNFNNSFWNTSFWQLNTNG